MWLQIDMNRDGLIEQPIFAGFLYRYLKFLRDLLPEVSSESLKPAEAKFRLKVAEKINNKVMDKEEFEQFAVALFDSVDQIGNG
mmetsp:Transcript_48595/g.67522  ORF Transcript_48595/g.67522 Transcript_48595/m.67522 type:complete len:84 (-) Transcript_48595:16-267(-)